MSTSHPSSAMRRRSYIIEAAYAGNLGFEEMVKFYRTASDQDIRKMEKLLADDKIKAALKLLQKVTGIKLRPFRVRPVAA